jgi:inhibitor of KinA sporulation pathway (predicted exonuclease)
VFSHDVIVFDLEATASVNERGFQTNNYIIDIGAVYLKGNLEKIDEFSSLVKPEESISPFIENLTGITNQMVEEALLFSAVGENFESWIASHEKRVKRVRLAAWGAYFDGPLLRRLYETYESEFPFSGTIIDVKSMAILALALMGRRTDQLNVTSCAKILGIEIPSHLHRALVDAQLTAEILKKLWVFFGEKKTTQEVL